jgi:Rieske Fe-S protein
MTRRAALVAGVGLAATAVAGGLAGRALEPAVTSKPTAGGPINPVNGRWVDVAAVSDLVEGQGKRVTAATSTHRPFTGLMGPPAVGFDVTAVTSICTHLPCELWWNGGRGLLDCSCHPASFTPDGKSTDQTYPLPTLNQVHVRVTAGGRVEVLGTA